MEVTSRTLAILAALLCLSLSYASAREEENGQDFREEKKEKWFLASYYTTTFTALSVFTSQRPYFCIQASNAQACTGRRSLRRKRKLNIENEAVMKQDTVSLDVSDDAKPPSELLPNEATDSEGKLFFTVWKSTTTTVTVTSLSTVKNITISLSARCTHGAFNDIPVCG